MYLMQVVVFSLAHVCVSMYFLVELVGTISTICRKSAHARVLQAVRTPRFTSKHLWGDVHAMNVVPLFAGFSLSFLQ
ncbi:hypothetical protein B0T22DRAFT_447172 [Podospora appendiculata]|uniref:Uncharacterized protein n=1 Tax=Podospora appendiculata TaxID=314037 RepID=A0AAE1CFH6_9PEZI|nr:hypothetical protein B0T22DRAFT_447172 [Podospora appendiculata]